MAAPKLHVVGNLLVTAVDDLPVTLRGVHLYYFTHKAQDVNTDASSTLELGWAEKVIKPEDEGGWGANTLIIFVDSEPANNDATGAYSQSQVDRWLAHVDALVNLCRTGDAYLILTWHHASGQLGHPGVIDAAGQDAMAALASRYANEDHVLYITQAEPAGDQSGGAEGDWGTIQKPAQLETISRIREQKSDAVIGWSGLRWTQHFDEALNNRIDSGDPGNMNLFVQPHFYATDPLEYTRADELAAIWPVVVAEYGPNQAGITVPWVNDGADGNRGHCGWALTKQGGPEMLAGDSLDTNRTAWGDTMRSDLIDNYEPMPVPGSAPPSTVPDEVVPTPNDAAILDGALLWADNSVDVSVSELTDVVSVNYSNSFGDFQLQAPETLQLEDLDRMWLLLKASSFQLEHLRLSIFPSSSGSATYTRQDLREFVTQTYSDGWKLIEVSVQDQILDSGAVASNPQLRRIELSNRQGSPLGEIEIADWVGVHVPKLPSVFEEVVAPANSVAERNVAGPPTIRVKDEDGNTVPNVRVSANLNQGRFTVDSVVERVSDDDGIVVFDAIRVASANTGYAITYQEVR